MEECTSGDDNMAIDVDEDLQEHLEQYPRSLFSPEEDVRLRPIYTVIPTCTTTTTTYTRPVSSTQEFRPRPPYTNHQDPYKDAPPNEVVDAKYIRALRAARIAGEVTPEELPRSKQVQDQQAAQGTQDHQHEHQAKDQRQKDPTQSIPEVKRATAVLTLNLATANRYSILNPDQSTNETPEPKTTEEEYNQTPKEPRNPKKRKKKSPSLELNPQKSPEPKTQNQEDPRREPQKPNKMPPLVIREVRNFSNLQQTLTKIIGGRFSASVRGNSVQIHTTREKDYEDVKELLKKGNTPFHTYKREDQKGIRIVIKGIHTSVTEEEVKEELESMEYRPIHIFRMTNFNTQKKIPIVAVELINDPHNRSIYGMEYFLHQKVVIEPQKRPLIAICARCSQYDHTKGECHNIPKCGKCSKEHEVDSCTETTLKCPKCNSDQHPVTYRRCPVYMKEEERRTTRKQPSQPKTPKTPIMQNPGQPKTNPWFRKEEQKKEAHTNTNVQQLIMKFVNQAISWVINFVKEQLPSLMNTVINLVKQQCSAL